MPVYYTTFTIASVAAGGLVYSEFSCLIDPVTEELDTVRSLVTTPYCHVLLYHARAFSIPPPYLPPSVLAMWPLPPASLPPLPPVQVHALLFGFGCLLLFLGVYLVSSVSTPSSYP